MKIEKILFPTDFSKVSRAALPHALELAEQFGAAVTLLHVRTLYGDDPNLPEYQFLDEGKYQQYIDESLGRLRQQADPGQKMKTAIVRDLNPGSAILAYLEEEGIDLVVMGTHGRSAVAHFFLGSVAEEVVRHAPCPVLTVAGLDKAAAGRPQYRKIMVAFDFSDHSRQAARQAQALARRCGAQLLALYVIQQEVPPTYLAMWKKAVLRDLPKLEEEVQEAVSRTVNGGTGLEVYVVIGEGKAHSEITRFASANQVDLIVMGTHGRSGMDRLLLGSTTERVVRTASCPVLCFKLAQETP